MLNESLNRLNFSLKNLQVDIDPEVFSFTFSTKSGQFGLSGSVPVINLLMNGSIVTYYPKELQNFSQTDDITIDYIGTKVQLRFTFSFTSIAPSLG